MMIGYLFFMDKAKNINNDDIKLMFGKNFSGGGIRKSAHS